MEAWEKHYTRERSMLSHPDENLVRLLARSFRDRDVAGMTALDLGCGTGRHLRLLREFAFGEVIGMDASMQALLQCGELAPAGRVQNDNRAIPLRDRSIDVVVAWGSLHYNHKDDFPLMLAEIRRVLKPGGQLLATVRSSRDRYLKKGEHLGRNVWITDLSDIKGSVTAFYSESELRKYFAGFGSYSYGLIERTMMGDLKARISHWVVQAYRKEEDHDEQRGNV